jgi:Uma2 family endonuclease
MSRLHRTSPLVDPEDPRAPSVEQWAALSPEERAAVLDALPSEFPLDEASPPEGDEHRRAKELATDALSSFFERTGRRIYVSAELPVYYPGERMFAPDVIAVVEVDNHPRKHWTVAHENRGLDFVLEILVSGRRRKDLVENPARYARLGIPEYFVLDLGRQTLWGWRLATGESTYHSVLPVRGMLPSRMLGLELSLQDGRLRFHFGPASVPQSRELIVRLEAAVAEQTQKRQDEARALQEALEQAEARLAEEARLRAEEARLRAEEARRREIAEGKAEAAEERAKEATAERARTEQQLVEALAEIARLRKEREPSS